jgi:hypothetical protein
MLPGPVDGAVVGEDVVADVCSGVVCCAEFVGLRGIRIGFSKGGSRSGKSFQFVRENRLGTYQRVTVTTSLSLPLQPDFTVDSVSAV